MFPIITGLAAMMVALVAFGDMLWQLLREPEVFPKWRVQHLAGLAIGSVGVILRQVAIRTLGERFRDEVAWGEQHVIETGGICPFHVV